MFFPTTMYFFDVSMVFDRNINDISKEAKKSGFNCQAQLKTATTSKRIKLESCDWSQIKAYKKFFPKRT